MVHSRIAIVTNGTGLLMRVVGGSNDSEVITNEVAITWVINNSGQILTYLAPNGSSETVGNDKFDLWVGTRRAFEEIAAESGGVPLNDMKFYFNGGVGTIAFDDLKVTGIVDDPLPVELTYFRAQPTEAGHVRVQWATASEKNSHYFAIERSADARTFTEVARRDAAGTIQESLRYEITDTQPLPGTSYYRLRQVDLDGTAHLYRPVSVNLGGASPQLRVFPNPSDGRQLLVRLAGAGDATVSLRTISGAALAFWQSQSGADELALTPNQPLAPGVYLLSVKTSHQTFNQKVVVE